MPGKPVSSQTVYLVRRGSYFFSLYLLSWVRLNNFYMFKDLFFGDIPVSIYCPFFFLGVFHVFWFPPPSLFHEFSTYYGYNPLLYASSKYFSQFLIFHFALLMCFSFAMYFLKWIYHLFPNSFWIFSHSWKWFLTSKFIEELHCGCTSVDRRGKRERWIIRGVGNYRNPEGRSHLGKKLWKLSTKSGDLDVQIRVLIWACLWELGLCAFCLLWIWVQAPTTGRQGPKWSRNSMSPLMDPSDN